MKNNILYGLLLTLTLQLFTMSLMALQPPSMAGQDVRSAASKQQATQDINAHIEQEKTTQNTNDNPDCEWNPTHTYTFKNTTGQIQPIELNVAFYYPAEKSRDAMTLTLPAEGYGSGTVRPPNNLYWPNWTTGSGTYDPTTQKYDPTKKPLVFKGQTFPLKTDRCIRHIELTSLPNYETGQGFSQQIPIMENGKTTIKRSGVFDPGIPNIECNNIVLQQGEAARACTRTSDNKTGGFGLAPNEHAVCMDKNYEIFVNTYNGIKTLCLREV